MKEKVLVFGLVFVLSLFGACTMVLKHFPLYEGVRQPRSGVAYLDSDADIGLKVVEVDGKTVLQWREELNFSNRIWKFELLPGEHTVEVVGMTEIDSSMYTGLSYARAAALSGKALLKFQAEARKSYRVVWKKSDSGAFHVFVRDDGTKEAVSEVIIME